MKITVDYVRVNQYTRPARKNYGVKGIVEHYTASNGATAQNIRDYFDGTCINIKRYAGAHYAVDRFKIIQMIPDNEVAYHAHDNSRCYIEDLKPNANFNTIGIELCIEKDGSLHPDTVRNAAELTTTLVKRHGLTATKVYRHYDITGKPCPLMWVKNPAEFTFFRNEVANRLKGLAPSTPAPSAHKDELVHKVVAGETLWGIAKDHGVTVDQLKKLNPKYAEVLPVGVYVTIRQVQSSGVQAPKPTAPAIKYPLPYGVFSYGERYSQNRTAVKQIQTALNAANFKCGTPDGIYGANTVDAVKRFQSVYVGDVDGIYGNDTRAALNRKVN